MSSSTLHEPIQANVHARFQEVADIVASNNLLLNDDLEATEKWGFRWIVLVIISPFCSLCGCDVFLHVRVDSVIRKFQAYLDQNRHHLVLNIGERSFVRREEITFISERIIAPFKQRTHHRYDARLDLLLAPYFDMPSAEDETRRIDEARQTRRVEIDTSLQTALLQARSEESQAGVEARLAEIDLLFQARLEVRLAEVAALPRLGDVDDQARSRATEELQARTAEFALRVEELQSLLDARTDSWLAQSRTQPLHISMPVGNAAVFEALHQAYRAIFDAARAQLNDFEARTERIERLAEWLRSQTGNTNGGDNGIAIQRGLEQLFECAPITTPQILDSAFRQWARRGNHPDKAPPELRERADAAFKEVNNMVGQLKAARGWA